MHPPFRLICLVCLAGLIAITAQAEPRTLWVKVLNLKDRPVRTISVGAQGSSTYTITNDQGLARVILAPQIKPGTWVTLQVSPDDYAFVSPWDSKIPVPSFMSESENYVTVYLTAR